jgi:hypothetical protein
MIPIPGNLIPTSIRDSWKVRAIVALLSVVVVTAILIYDFKQSARELIEGPRLVELDKQIALHLFDSVSVALNAYRTEHGYYPQVDGKYFFDSLKRYVNVSDVLVYADTFDSHGVARAIQNPPGKRFDYHNISHTYLGVGRSENIIVYKHLPPNSYLLYWIGENVIDEGGSGDDLVFRH